MLLRIAAGGLALAVVLALLVLAHRYLLERLVFDAGVPEPARSALGAAVALLGVTMVLQPVAERLLPLRVARVLAWPAYVWMGALFLVLTLTLFSDALLWLLGAAWPPGAPVDPSGPARLRALAVAGARRGGDRSSALRGALRGPELRRLELAPRALARGARRLPHRADQRHPRRPAARPPLRSGAHRARQRPRAGPRRGDRRPRRRRASSGCAPRSRPSPALRAPARRLLRDREPRLVLGRRRLGGRARARSASARCATSASRSARARRASTSPASTTTAATGCTARPATCERALAGRDPRASGRAARPRSRRPSARRRRSGVDLQLSGHTHGGQIWPFRWLVRLVVALGRGPARRGTAPALREPRDGLLGPAAPAARPRRDHGADAPAAGGASHDRLPHPRDRGAGAGHLRVAGAAREAQRAERPRARGDRRLLRRAPDALRDAGRGARRARPVLLRRRGPARSAERRAPRRRLRRDAARAAARGPARPARRARHRALRGADGRAHPRPRRRRRLRAGAGLRLPRRLRGRGALGAGGRPRPAAHLGRPPAPRAGDRRRARAGAGAALRAHRRRAGAGAGASSTASSRPPRSTPRPRSWPRGSPPSPRSPCT